MTARLVLAVTCLIAAAANTTSADDQNGQTDAKASPSDLVGKPAPALGVGDLFNGPAELSFKKLHGKVVLVNFWMRSCPVCVKKLDRMEALHKKYKDDGLVVIGVHHSEESEGLGEWLRGRGVTYAVGIDKGDTRKEYAIGEWPTYFLVNKAGEIVWDNTKEPPTDRQIEELLGS